MDITTSVQKKLNEGNYIKSAKNFIETSEPQLSTLAEFKSAYGTKVCCGNIWWSMKTPRPSFYCERVVY